ncbi:hypothetical protein RM844_25540 [Streptomyces sp. DSM 44915]|uniref:Uncharacterized protein n=1 Tax=Streptomyces chisholmiae TaxID=3075540 RepID=A0ABU2JXC8_9ACTN|nr:hypothetical protein [Streptomyces sp. DSM 44915]MDT0269651.1 hypothetical protein [Streptomyces sp. DSM 44915]
MAVHPRGIVDRLFEQLEAEYFDFTVTVSDREDDERWVQLRGNAINLPYPHQDAPERVLPPLDLFGELSWSVADWEAGRYLTVDWGPADAGAEPVDERGALAEVLGRVLDSYLGLPADSDRWVVAEQ